MALTEDLALFFADFGVSAVFGAQSSVVLLDLPDMDVLEGMAISNNPAMTYASSEFPSLVRGSSITVNGSAYTVREVRKLDDGALSQAMLVPA